MSKNASFYLKGQVPHQRKLEWTARMDATLRSMWLDPWNYTVDHIAEGLGVQNHHIDKRVAQLKLGLRPSKREIKVAPPNKSATALKHERWKRIREEQRRRRFGFSNPVRHASFAGQSLVLKEVEPDTRALIDAAVAAGKVTRIPRGEFAETVTQWYGTNRRDRIANSNSLTPAQTMMAKEARALTEKMAVGGKAGHLIRVMAAAFGQPVSDDELAKELGINIGDRAGLATLASYFSNARAKLVKVGLDITRKMRGSAVKDKVGRAMVWTQLEAEKRHANRT